MTNPMKILALVPAVLLLAACGSGPGMLSNPLKDSGIKLCEYTATNPKDMDFSYFKDAAEGSDHADIKASAAKIIKLHDKYASSGEGTSTIDGIDAYFGYAEACSNHGINQPFGNGS